MSENKPPIDANGSPNLTSGKPPASVKLPKDVREWFSTMSPNDRVVAFSFVDGPMFSVVSNAASSLSTSTQSSSSGGKRTTDERLIQEDIDWEAKVMLRDVEKSLEAAMSIKERDSLDDDEATTGSLTADEVPADSSINCSVESTKGDAQDSNDDDKKEAIEEEPRDDAVESDAFRIREGEANIDTKTIVKSDNAIAKDGCDGEQTVENSEENKPNLSHSSESYPSPLSSKVNDVMGKVCVLFSPVFKLSHSNTAIKSQPFITLHPSYIRSVKSEDLLFALDELMKLHSSESHSFLSDPGSSSWIEVVRAACNHPASDTPSVPLYMLLLLRFQIAVFDSFRMAMAGNATEVHKEASADNKTDAKKIKIDQPTSTSAGQSTDFNDSTPEKISSETKSPLSALLPSLLSRLCVTKNIDATRFCDMMSSLSITFPQLSRNEHVLENYLFIPMVLVIGKLSSSNIKTHHHNMESIYVVVEEAVKRIEEEFPALLDTKEISATAANDVTAAHNLTETPKGNAGGANSDTTATTTGQQACSDVNQGPGGKKNTKKKKKKKKKKGQVGGQPAQTNDINTQTPGKNSEKTEKLDEACTSLGNEEKAENIPKAIPTVSQPPSVAHVKRVDMENPISISESADEVSKNSSGDDVNTEPVDGSGKKDEPQVSQSDRVGATSAVAVQPGTNESKKPTGNEAKATHATESEQSNKDDHNDDHSTWETVEVRSRGNRKKASDRSNGRFASQQGAANSAGGQNGNASKKKFPRTSNSRIRNKTRKMIREIVFSVIDSVDEEVRKRRQAASWREGARLPGNKWAAAVAKGKAAEYGTRQTNSADTQKPNSQNEATMRDVLIGRQGSTRGVSGSSPQLTQRMYSERAHQRPDPRGDGKNVSSQHALDSKKSRGKLDRADQNTAPTVPETLSAMSANETLSTRNLQQRNTGAGRSDSSSGDSVEAVKPPHTSSQKGKEASPSPPLPTLLSPGNVNSASSSVASSLEAPRAGHHSNHHSFYPGNENDVGYHLLDVCDRLTRDIQVFMKRREHALEIRRRERGSVLAALQESLSSLWPGMCSVEMYGSCATELDLPSSDLDVVVCGLDRAVEAIVNPPSSPNRAISQSEPGRQAKDTNPEGRSSDTKINQHEIQQHASNHTTQHVHPHMPMYGHLSLNAERVIRLAMELERQPWAVHVKAIPTASVPVIKILADPARLSGNGEWLMQHPMTTQATPENNQSSENQTEANNSNQTSNQNSIPHFHNSQTPPPWRGADVVNGLLNVDITFEGPEHGGIGSTTFSSHAVQEFCNETGLPPEGTAFVQALMVLKELLAQRRLNEPFSGGLSSYALLLLVISVVHERSIIREELERVERQRRQVAAGGDNSILRVTDSESATIATGQKQGTKAKAVVPQNDDKRTKAPKANEKSGHTVDTGSVPQRQNFSDVVASKNKEPVKNGLATEPLKSTVSTTEMRTKPGRQDNDKVPSKTSKPVGGGGSWASIARKSAPAPPSRKSSQESIPEKVASTQQSKSSGKVSSFADAVAKGTAGGQATSGPTSAAPQSVSDSNKSRPKQIEAQATVIGSKDKAKEAKPKQSNMTVTPATAGADDVGSSTANRQNMPPNTYDSGMSLFPQGFHDVVEVLCSGETTSGKLLMHFLLFYGRHFDSQSTAIDYSGTHQRDPNANNGYSVLSPFMQRRTAGSYDPMTGMLTVDPIVVYDPLEGAETTNVARSCFAWSSIRWVFAQSYMTLSSVVEMSAGHSPGQSGNTRPNEASTARTNGISNEYTPSGSEAWNGPYGHDESGNMMLDPSSSLLELLLSV